MSIGNKIKTHRKSLGLNQTELGNKVGVKKNAVSKWECGRVEGIPISTVKALADLFGVTASYLIDDDIPEVSSHPLLQVSKSSPTLPTSDELEILRKFRLLDPRGQAAVMNVLNHEYEALPGEKACSPAKEA